MLVCHNLFCNATQWKQLSTYLLVEDNTSIYFLVPAFKDPSNPALILFLLTLTNMVFIVSGSIISLLLLNKSTRLLYSTAVSMLIDQTQKFTV